MEHLAVQGDDAEPMTIGTGHGDGVIHGLHNDGFPQEIGENLPVLAVAGQQVHSDAHKSAALFQAPLL